VVVQATAEVPVTSTLMAALVPASTPFVSAGAPCRDGETVGNLFDNVSRVPVGLAENAAVIEVSWSGNGFGGFERAVIVVPRLDGVQVFLNRVSTVHMLRYCGTLAEVENYVSDKTTHIHAMVVTAVDSQGQKPEESEIGAWSLSIQTGVPSSLVNAPKGPSLAEVRSHIEVVRLISLAYDTPASKSTQVATATPKVQAKTPVSVAKCVPTTLDLGPWEARDRPVQGPAAS